MSFFTMTCAWCGEKFTAGMVGRTLVGTGHTCEAHKPCDHKGCAAPSIFAVSKCESGPMGWLVGRGFDFCCTDHVDGRTVFQTQGKRPAAEALETQIERPEEKR